MEANPNFRAGTTPILTTNFLSRIESASPSAPDLSEDDTGISWGHHQFTSGSMTIKSILTSWESVGSTVMARKLIAAGIKTCKVACHICFDNSITTSSYLADAYLSNMVDQLWDVWTAAGGVSITKNVYCYYTNSIAKPTSTGNATAVQMGLDQNPPSSPPASSPPASTFVGSTDGPSVCSMFVLAGAEGGSVGPGPASEGTMHKGGRGSADEGKKGRGSTDRGSTDKGLMGAGSTGRDSSSMGEGGLTGGGPIVEDLMGGSSTGGGFISKVGGGPTSGVKANSGLQVSA
jgi:hypothetical protein